MATNNTTNWSESLEKNIDHWEQERFAQFPDYIPMIAGKVLNTQLGLVRHQASAGLGFVPQVGEGVSTPDASFQKAYQTILVPKTFRVNVPVTMEAYEDEQYGIFKDRAGELADAAMRTANVYLSSVLINAQSTSYTSYGDGKPLASTSHTSPSGAAAKSNASSTNSALNEINLFTGVRAQREQKNDADVRFNMGDKPLLIVPGALEKLAQEITRSLKKSNANVNDLNWYEGVVDSLVVPWIGASDNAIFAGSDTRWLVTSKASGMSAKNFITFLWRKRPEFSNWIDNKTKSYNMDVLMRFAYGWSHWLGVWASAGTGTGTYTD